MDSKSCTIGVLGGMGTYATIHLFRQYAAVFPAEKEWERPRIIIDNRCTMPSRVRAALYGENRQRLVDEMSDSVRNLEKSGCNRILLACNTAHLFLADIMRQVPEAEGKIVNIIEVCADGLIENDEKEVFLLASEGTIDSGIYQEACSARGIRCEAPGKEEYTCLRDCIEAVKRDQYSDGSALHLPSSFIEAACVCSGAQNFRSCMRNTGICAAMYVCMIRCIWHFPGSEKNSVRGMSDDKGPDVWCI